MHSPDPTTSGPAESLPAEPPATDSLPDPVRFAAPRLGEPSDAVTTADLGPGDRVALLVPGSAQYVAVTLSLLHAGVFPVPLDPALTPAERAEVLQDVRPALVVTDSAALDALRTLGPARLSDALPLGRPMHLTSGTTGRRKAVHSGLLTAGQSAAMVREEQELWRFGPDEVHLVVSPLYHSAPLRFAQQTLLAGGRVVVPGPFDPVVLTDAIRTQRPTSMIVVPTHLQRLFAHWDATGWPDLTSLRTVAHAGAPCPPEVKERLVARFPPGSTWEFYGSTEGQFTAVRSEDQRAHPSSVGKARPGRRMFADAEGHLWCVVPEHARFRYFGSPEKDAETWQQQPDGPAFTLGDVGTVDVDGWVHLAGRRSDLIISGGVNVYPLEVELALRELPGVLDVAVHGVADAEWGQRVVASVVRSSDGPDEHRLSAFARERLSPARRPKEYRFVTDLPRNPTGKVLRHLL